ncbi:M56 family metallopeptidase [Winogradskyella sp. 3972H.M.0a.05]|uniref:M56 family metallopeptidase n=1 Tax=Winogradskyella sp. 3972H.M.0a.05 TaxID=2950277 RepID=UPI00339726EF
MEYLLKASAVLIIFYVCYRIFLQRDTFFQSNRWFLLTGFFIAICIPYLAIPIYVEYTPREINTSIITGSVIPMTQDNIEPTVDLITLLTWGYLSGLIFFSVRFFIEITSLSQVIYGGTKERSGKYSFVKTPSQMPPFSFFNWIVFNPKQFNDKELELIINHEKVHANQWHSIDIILSQLITIIFWFNPFVWLYKKSLQQNLEYIADHNAQSVSSCDSSYQKLLLKTSVKGLKLSLVNNFYSSLIKKRIVMLHKNRSNKKNQWKPLLVLPLLAVFLMSFNTKTIYIEKEASLKSNNFVGDYTLNMEKAFHSYLGKEETPKVANKVAPKKVKTQPRKATTTVNAIGSAKPTVAFTEVVKITKDFSKADFESLKAELKEKGITIKFKGIKRNNQGEITAISINAESGNSKVKYSANDDDAIDPITIKFDKNNISISDSKELHFVNGHKVKVVGGKHRSTGSANVYFHSDDDDDHDVDIIIKQDGKKHKVRSSNGFTYRIHSDDDTDIGKYTEYLFIKDGKEISVEELEKIYPGLVKSKSITTFDIIKGDKALKKYGDKAKNGVIILNTGKSGSGNVFFHDDGEVEEIIIKGSGARVWTDDEDVTVGKIGKGKGNYFFISGNEDGEEPLFILDGKEIKRDEIVDLDTDSIEKINVIKGDEAIKKYGDKAKNGVVVIYTKKE